MTEQDFNKIVKSLGGKYDFNTSNNEGEVLLLKFVLNDLRETVKEYEEALKSGKKHVILDQDEIYLDFINNYSINAYAFENDKTKKKFIGINIGLPIRLLAYFNTLMSTNDVLEKIGDCKKEKESIKNIKVDLYDCLKNSISSIKFTEPICKKRGLFASKLWYHSLNFVLAHEIGHHFLSHIKYNKSKYSLDIMSEIVNDKFYMNNKSYYSESQAMEIEADRFGFDVMINLGSDLAFDEFNKYANPESFTYLAIALTFHIFDEMNINKSIDRLQTHPNPSVRKCNLLFDILRFQIETKGTEMGDLSHINFVLEELETLTPIISNFKFQQDYRSERVTDELGRLISISDSLRKEQFIKFDS